MKECPRCGDRIYNTATACKCGWKERATTAASTAPTLSHIQCAHMECTNNAIVKEKTPTGWANFCYPHMMSHANERAKSYCLSLGLQTSADCRAWLAKNQLLVKRAPILQREPGCDDE